MSDDISIYQVITVSSMPRQDWFKHAVTTYQFITVPKTAVTSMSNYKDISVQFVGDYCHHKIGT